MSSSELEMLCNNVELTAPILLAAMIGCIAWRHQAGWRGHATRILTVVGLILLPYIFWLATDFASAHLLQ